MKAAMINGRWVDVPHCQPTDTQLHRITVGLAEQGIRVAPSIDVFHVVHLWAQQETTTREEVAALAAFHAVTDCRLAWHEANAQ
jgi:alpha-D-ribose 1-methylphosphonate 5-triphosphate synthase subunit PhnL